MKSLFSKVANFQCVSRLCIVILIAVRMGVSDESQSWNIILRSGEHTGLFVHAEFGLVEDVHVDRYGGNLPRQTYHIFVGSNFGIGYSIAPCVIAHFNADLYNADRGKVHNLIIISTGPGLTWYTPFANTFLTGNIYYSLLDAQGGDASICNRWRLGAGKEVLIFKDLGVGLIGSYEGGRWADGSKGEPRWDLSGVRLNLTLTYN
jgi:hypothetical protein